MKIKVHKIPDEGMAISRDIDPKNWDLGPKGIALVDVVRTRLNLSKQGEGEVQVQGSVSSTMSAECSRCLKSFPFTLDSAFHLAYLPKTHLPPGGEQALSHESLDLYYYDGDEVDLEEELIGQLLLTVPMNPLCQAGCRGLCPQCGQDLNEKTCPCQVEPDDIRWADLKKFYKKESNAKPKT